MCICMMHSKHNHIKYRWRVLFLFIKKGSLTENKFILRNVEGHTSYLYVIILTILNSGYHCTGCPAICLDIVTKDH